MSFKFAISLCSLFISIHAFAQGGEQDSHSSNEPILNVVLNLSFSRDQMRGKKANQKLDQFAFQTVIDEFSKIRFHENSNGNLRIEAVGENFKKTVIHFQ